MEKQKYKDNVKYNCRICGNKFTQLKNATYKGFCITCLHMLEEMTAKQLVKYLSALYRKEHDR